MAERIGGIAIEGAPSPSQMPGSYLLAVTRSLLANGRSAVSLLRRLPEESVIYSSGETWGLPCALALRLSGKKHVTHIMFVHAVFSRA